MPNPLVSVIIPIYNVELYLKECLDSVIYQSYQNLEILLINDGSTDKSGDIAKEYASQDKRIRYFEQENQGQSVARNKGLDYVNGEYIYFLDSDDWIDLGYIEELVRKSDKQNTAINTNRVLFNTKIQERITTSFYPKKNGSFKLNPCSIDNLSFYVTNSLFKYKIIQKYSIRFPIGRSNAEDSDFLYRYICFAPYIIFYQGSIYHYRQRQDSTIGYIQQSQKIPLEPLDTFKSIYQWYQHYDFLYKYGLPFKLIYTFSGFEINKQEYFHTAKNLIKELKIPSAVIAKNHIMRAFMEAVDMDSFLYKRLTLNTNIFKRFFRIRLFHKNYNIIRLFGYTLYEKIASNANGGGARLESSLARLGFFASHNTLDTLDSGFFYFLTSFFAFFSRKHLHTSFYFAYFLPFYTNQSLRHKSFIILHISAFLSPLFSHLSYPAYLHSRRSL